MKAVFADTAHREDNKTLISKNTTHQAVLK
jgi:hypothetical protein